MEETATDVGANRIGIIAADAEVRAATAIVKTAAVV